MGNSTISVIVPCYNEEKTITDCLNSVINQTYTNLEIIVVYKESQDNTLNLIKSFDDSRINLVYQTENTGIGGARNLGIENSSGDYFCFVECTELDLDYCEKLFNAISKDDSDIVTCPVANLGRLKHFNIKKYKPFTVSSLMDKIQIYDSGATFAKLFKTKLIKDNNIVFPTNMIYEDNPFLFRSLYYAKKVSGTVDCVYKYFPTGEINQNKQKVLKDLLYIAKDIFDFAKTNNFKKQEMSLLKKKMFKSFLKGNITEPNFYKNVTEIIGFDKYIYCQYIRLKIKKEIKKVLNIKEKK